MGPSTGIGTGLGGAHTHTLSSPVAVNRRKIKKTRLTEGLSALRALPDGADLVKNYFKPVRMETAIEALGNYNPLMGGRPKDTIMSLLLGVNSEVRGRGWQFKTAGLMYYTPCVLGQTRQCSRTTTAGLALLDHWAEKSPAFARFVDAFVSDKARKEILADCVDLTLGGLPAWMLARIEKHKVKVAAFQIAMEKERQAALERQMQMDQLATTSLWGASQTNQTLTDYMLMQQKVMNAKQKAMMLNQQANSLSVGANIYNKTMTQLLGWDDVL